MKDTIYREDAINAIRASTKKYTGFMEMEQYTDDDAVEAIEGLPSVQSYDYSDGFADGYKQGRKDAQPDIKQAAKLLLDFIESCPGGDSYLTTPDGEELRTDWGYAMDGVQLIYDWAERRTDEAD